MTYDLRADLAPSRVVNAMWDFSWLRGHYPGGPMADWEAGLDGLVERRFNAVRIDAFPLILAQAEADQPLTVLPQPNDTWGHSDRPVVHRFGAELVECVGLCRLRGLSVILSAWNMDGVEGLPARAQLAGRRDLLVRGWDAVLRQLDQHGLLGSVLYIDFDQEFPFFSLEQARLDALGGSGQPGEDAMLAAGRRPSGPGLEWNQGQMAHVAAYANEIHRHFHRSWPQVRCTISLTRFWKEWRAMDLKCFDVLETHHWIHEPRFDERTGFNDRLDKSRAPGDRSGYQRRVTLAMQAMRPMYLAAMDRQLAYAADWARELSAPLITTEAWGPWWHMDHADLDWDWLQDWCADCMRLAAGHGLWGATPWNFSHPYFSTWRDISWYRAVNGAFLATPSPLAGQGR